MLRLLRNFGILVTKLRDYDTARFRGFEVSMYRDFEVCCLVPFFHSPRNGPDRIFKLDHSHKSPGKMLILGLSMLRITPVKLAARLKPPPSDLITLTSCFEIAKTANSFNEQEGLCCQLCASQRGSPMSQHIGYDRPPLAGRDARTATPSNLIQN
jgi:hypothetical protein